MCVCTYSNDGSLVYHWNREELLGEENERWEVGGRKVEEWTDGRWEQAKDLRVERVDN